MLRVCFFLLGFIVLSCSTDAIENEESQENGLTNRELIIDNVIACAANNENDDLISVFFFPRPGTTNFQYFETENETVDKNDFSNYTAFDFPIVDVFNGFLKKFEISSTNEKWVIVAFDEDGVTNISNPIRLKQLTKPTEYITENVAVDASSTMPIFSWEDGLFDDNAIYFHVLTELSNDFISGTYTFEKNFQFYNLDNVVLNITPELPRDLDSGETYNFSLLGVSEDNWVNLFSEFPFQID